MPAVGIYDCCPEGTVARERARWTRERVFLGRSAQPMTRFGVHDIVSNSLPQGSRATSGQHYSTSESACTTPIRHTTATHLLRAGVDIKHDPRMAETGHGLHRYNEHLCGRSDLEMKAKALGIV